jgi:tetratricopeptide (TPR) repeat protein
MRFSVLILLLLVSSHLANAQTSSAKWKMIEAKGDTLFERQDYAGAIPFYTKAIEISQLKDREAKGILYKRAVCLYSTGDFDGALSDINSFIPEFPYFPQAKLLRAFINRELDKSAEQLEDINELLTLNPNNPDLIKWKASIYLDEDKFADAKRELTQLQKLVNDEEIETQLGFVYGSLDQPDSAFMHYENALNLNAGYVPAYLYITTLCLDQDAFDTALTYADLGLRLEPSNANLIFYKGIALVETKQVDAGCRLILKAFEAGVDQASGYLQEYCYKAED